MHILGNRKTALVTIPEGKSGGKSRTDGPTCFSWGEPGSCVASRRSCRTICDKSGTHDLSFLGGGPVEAFWLINAANLTLDTSYKSNNQ